MSIFKKIKEKGISKKAIVITVIVVVAAIIGGVVISGLGKPANADIMPFGEVRTTTLEKTDVVNSIEVSGNVESKSTVNITSTGANKVTEIFVQVGDTVKNGDVIATLDNTDIKKEISELNTKLKQNITNAEENVTKAQTEANRAYDKSIAAEGTLNTAKNNTTAAKNAYDNVAVIVKPYQDSYNTAFSYQQQKAVEDTNAQAAVTQALAAMNNAKIEWDNALLSSASDAAQKETAYNDAKWWYDTTKAAYDASDIKRIYAEAIASTNSAKKALDDAILANNFTQIEATYNQAVSAQSMARETLDNLEKLYENATEALKTAKENLAAIKDNKELEKLNEQLDECNIKATANGVITSLNMTVGSAPSATSPILAVIQDTDNLVVSTAFKESDIKNVQVGQEVTIISDATGDKQIKGRVSQVSLTGGMSASGSSEVTFQAEIEITTKDSGLLIGMNAKAQVITKKTENVFAVPDDAIGTYADGGRYILVQKDGEYIPVAVTVGESTDYMTQIISDELKEGMIVRSSCDEIAGFTGDMSEMPEMDAGQMQGGGATMSVRPAGGMMRAG